MGVATRVLSPEAAVGTAATAASDPAPVPAPLGVLLPDSSNGYRAAVYAWLLRNRTSAVTGMKACVRRGVSTIAAETQSDMYPKPLNLPA